jgi:hypothetical protein
MRIHATLVMALTASLAIAQVEAPAAKEGQKAAPPFGVSVIELGGRGDLVLTGVENPTVEIPLTLENTVKNPLVASIEVTPFCAASGECAQPTFRSNGQTISSVALDPRRTARVVLSAFLRETASFRAIVRINVGNALFSFPVTVNRIAAAAADIRAPLVQQVTRKLGSDRPLLTSVSAIAKAPILEPPTLIEAVRKTKPADASGTTVDVRLVPQDARSGLQNGSTLPIKLELAGLDAPGRYEAVVRFTASGYRPADTTIVVDVRDPAWLAALLIALGIVLSLIVQYYARVMRPLLLVETRVARLQEELRNAERMAAGNAEASDLVAEVRDRISKKWNSFGIARVVPSTEFDVYEAIAPALSRWIEVRKLLGRVRPKSIQDALMPTLANAKACYLAEGPSADNVRTSIEAVNSLPNQMSLKVLEALKAGIQSLEGELQTETAAAFVEIRADLRLLKVKVDSGPVQEALPIFDSVRLRYARARFADLKARIASVAAPPPGLTPEGWKKIADRLDTTEATLGETTDPDEATTALLTVTKDYLDAASSGLEYASTQSALPPATRDEIAKAAADVRSAIARDDLRVAWIRFADAQRLFAPSVGGAGHEMAMGGAAALAGAAIQPASFSVLDSFWYFPSAEGLGSPGREAELRRELTRVDYLISGVVFVFAVLVGVQAVWLSSPTWGGFPAYAVALLWGFGVDQLSHAGVLALAKVVKEAH